uniref:Putative ovule protein n=1 Tax=Solanum chacoense TaxID=4108 RepID=A0A0V0HGX6_SOLCH
MAQSPGKVAAATTPLAGETKKYSLPHLSPSSSHTFTIFLPPPSLTFTNPKTISRRTSLVPLSTVFLFSYHRRLLRTIRDPHILSLLSGVPEGQKIPRCLWCTSPPLVYQTTIHINVGL